MKIKFLSDIVKAKDGSSLSVEDMRSQICAAAQNDKRFNTPAADNKLCGGYVYAQDLLLEGDDSWKAVISAMDGKMYEVGFDIKAGKVILATGDCSQVVKKTQYINASMIHPYVNGIVTAADGEVAGKPSLHSHLRKMSSGVQEAIKTDPRFQRQPGSNDYPSNPYVVDLLVPDDDGKRHAVISKPGGQMVKHGFTCDADGGNCKMDAGDSEPTECTPVYTQFCADYVEQLIKAVGNAEGAGKGNATKKTATAAAASTVAHAASVKAHESGEDADHSAAASSHASASDAHSSAMIACAKCGDKDEANSHAKQMTAHDSMADAHKKSDVQARDAAVSQFVKAKDKPTLPTGIVTCHASAALSTDEKWSMDKPAKFMWMPAGTTTVTAHYEGAPIRMTVECDDKTTSVVQTSFDHLKKTFPKQKPFGCIEHREEESAFNPEAFEWVKPSDAKDGGVYCTALPTGLGVKNVNERIHRSFSPSFATDADYKKSKLDASGCRYFPDGVRGSSSNPCRVTGVGFSVGSLTNKPAFHNISPVKAKDATGENKPAEKLTVDMIFASLAKQASPPVTKPGATGNKNQMKIKIIKAHGEYKVGTEVEVEATAAATLIAEGYGVDAVQASEIAALKAERIEGQKGLIKASVKRAKDRKALAPKDEDVEKLALARAEKLAYASEAMEIVLETIDSLKGERENELLVRTTQAMAEKGLGASGKSGLFYGLNAQGSIDNACKEGYVTAREPMDKMIRSGDMKGACALSLSTSLVMQRDIMPIVKASGGELSLHGLVRAADVTDGNVGTIATGMILMRNLGFLKNKLAWLPYLTTDLRNEPATFNQPIFTRYITPPAVVSYNTTTGWADSTPSATDVTVTMDQHKGVQITFQTQLLGSTVRALFAEQQGAQFYALAEAVNQFVLQKMFAATWTGPVPSLSLGVNFGLPGMVKIKNRMTLAKIPDIGRFALLHSYYHDAILTDGNMLTAKAIMALINKDDSAMNSGDVPELFGVKPLESQLAAYKAGVAAPLNIAADGTVDTSPATQIGFAGNMSSMLFVSRVPQDYTKVLSDIPATAAIEILTEPDSGLSIMFVKFLNHTLAATSARCALMYGAAQGDPRVGIVLTP